MFLVFLLVLQSCWVRGNSIRCQNWSVVGGFTCNKNVALGYCLVAFIFKKKLDNTLLTELTKIRKRAIAMDQYTNMSDELDPLRDPAPRRPSRRIMSSRRQRSRARQSSEPAASPSPSGRSATRQSHSSSQSHARESRSSGASQCQQTHQSHTRSHREEEYSLSFSADGYTSQRQSASHASNQDGPVHQQQQQEQEPDPFVSGSSPPTYGGAVSIQAQIERLKLKGFSTGTFLGNALFTI